MGTPDPAALVAHRGEAFVHRGAVDNARALLRRFRIGVDELAVVDTELRVRGIDGLRVADASVMPSVPSANFHATVPAIAERAAGLIQD